MEEQVETEEQKNKRGKMKSQEKTQKEDLEEQEQYDTAHWTKIMSRPIVKCRNVDLGRLRCRRKT